MSLHQFTIDLAFVVFVLLVAIFAFLPTPRRW
jgi:hypothetical protein